MNFRSFFSIFPGWSEEELDETSMLNDFVADIDPSERQKNVKWIFTSCNPSETATPACDEKVVRKSFGACLKALGGISKKRHGRTVWTSVRQNRVPIFKRLNI
jgi:hypothetical protein